jgi:hypothetical protein
MQGGLVLYRWGVGPAQSRCRCGSGRAQSRRRCGQGVSPSLGADGRVDEDIVESVLTQLFLKSPVRLSKARPHGAGRPRRQLGHAVRE